MRNLLALIGLLVIGFVGLGWYMGWYKLSFSRTSDGNLEIKTNVDTKKVGEDSSEFLKNAATVIGSHADKAAQEAKTVAPTPTGGTPGPVVAPQGAPNTPLTTPSAPGVPTVLPAAPQVAPMPSVPPRGPIQLVPPK